MLPPGNQRKNYVQFVNAHQPVHPADESQQEQVQGRKEQLTGDNLRMVGDYHRFINESGNAQQVANPDFWEMLREVACLASFVQS